MSDKGEGVGEKNYAACWNKIASDPIRAFELVDESLSEEAISEHGAQLAGYLVKGMKIGPEDTVLEIGCGVGRFGKELASHAGKWIGVDVSANMVNITRKRLAEFDNVETHVVSGADLSPLADNSVDKIYCHAVFIHMDKEDFYTYLVDARRVLKPGGIFYFDVWNLCDDAGWLRWQMERALYPSRADRPIHRNQFSTPDEVRAMLRMAGWEQLHQIETFYIHVFCTSVPEGVDREEHIAAVKGEYAEAFAGMRYDEGDRRSFIETMKANLAARGVEPERPLTP